MKGFGGLSDLQVGFIVALPTFASAIAMVAWTRHSDRRASGPGTWRYRLSRAPGAPRRRRREQPDALDARAPAALVGIYAAIATSWTLPTAFLSGTAAAGGLALINSIGNLGGFAGPYFMGWIKTSTGEYSLAFLIIGIGLALSGGFALAMRSAVASEHAAAATP